MPDPIIKSSIDDRTVRTFTIVCKVIEEIPFPDDGTTNNPDNIITVIIPIHSFELTFILQHNENNLVLLDELVHRLLDNIKLSYGTALTSFNKNNAKTVFEQVD